MICPFSGFAPLTVSTASVALTLTSALLTLVFNDSTISAFTAPLNPTSISVTAEYYDNAGATFRPWPTAGIPTSSPIAGVMVRIRVTYPWSAVSGVAGNLLSSAGSDTLTASSLMETRR